MYTSVDVLCKDCPSEFKKYVTYCKNMSFEEKPDYNYMRKLFIDLAKKKKINLDDNIYDWGVKAVTIKYYPEFYNLL